MPLLSITSNVDIAERQSVLKDISSTVARLLGKPESFVMVSFNHNPDMLFAGTDAPLAYLELKSIGLPADKTRQLSAGLCGLISDKLEIFPDRVYIEFADAQRHMWGWNGATF